MGESARTNGTKHHGARTGQNGPRRHSARAESGRLVSFNSARTAWALSLLLTLALVTQFSLIAYHDRSLLQLRALEGELSEGMDLVNSMATDAVNAAYEYNEGGSAASGSVPAAPSHGSPTRLSAGNSHWLNRYSNYSMEPLDILKRAGVDPTEGFVPSISVREARKAMRQEEPFQKKRADLPPVEDIQAMYGNHSYILGLERCEAFRNSVRPADRLMGPAGIFNSATNLLEKLLRLNCVNRSRRKEQKLPRATGMKNQAPWGKHNPVAWRLHHEAAVGAKGVQQEHFLPIVMVKDPVTWMASMCRHSYEARWRHTAAHCPNLVPNEHDRVFGRQPGRGTMGISVKFATKHIGDEPKPDRANKTFVHYDSLVDLWGTWYRQWYDAGFPRLIVRFEDLMFHAEETVAHVCACGGGTLGRRFRYVEESAKGEGGPHAGSAGFLASLVTYGNITLRNGGILKDERDLEYAREHLDAELMEVLGYAPI